MSLNLHVRNFRAVKSADIELSGLTVLAGVNSSGKSTLVRLFHRLICIEAEYDGYAALDTHRYFLKSVMEPLKKTILSDIRNSSVSHDIEWLSSPKWQIPRNFERIFLNISKSLKYVLSNEAIADVLRDSRFVNSISAYVPKMYSDVPQLTNPKETSQWVDAIEQFFVNRYKMIAGRGEGSSSLYFTAEVNGETLEGIKRTGYEGTLFENTLAEKQPIELWIRDGDIDVVDINNMKLPMGRVFAPRQSFYIARPSVDFPSVRTKILKLNGVGYSIHNKGMIDDSASEDIGVESIIGGKIAAPREKGYVATSDWLYNDGESSYNLNRCADGIKSLATISILDKYQLLNTGALLIIDEPEVHLHPQWVVEMARVLVRLAKERGVKVLVTTHSPDLVHALRDFSENENFSANTCFYLSHKAEQADTAYTFRPLGMEIGPIFTVFNRAKEQIAAIAQSIRKG